MFFATKDLKKYNPNENVFPEYDKDNYITPPKEKDSYTPEAPSVVKTPFAEVPIIVDEEEEEFRRNNILLGQDIKGFNDFYVSPKELNAMCLIVGATGAGKTECIKTLLEYALRNNHPIIIVDGKGDPKFPNEYKEMCDRNNRNFKLFCCESNKSLHYNPLRHGEYTELKDKLIDIFEWSEEYYKNQSERFLQGVFKVLLLPSYLLDLMQV